MAYIGVYGGPMRYIQKYQQVVPKRTADIVDAYLTVNSKTYRLESNQFRVYEGMTPDTLYIHHMYDYPDESGHRGGGHWYNLATPVEAIQILPGNRFVYVLDNYKDEETQESLGPAKVELIFTEKAANRLRTSQWLGMYAEAPMCSAV